MKSVLIMTFVALTLLSGCKVVPPGHDKSCGEGPGHSGTAPGQLKKNCR